ncbi:hypothetical protein HMPREF9554_02330 [Treponema phagedenis F0421]|nr:hypothetical protein HMPREF9554_02330 [Treponema phagedenis F0421]
MLFFIKFLQFIQNISKTDSVIKKHYSILFIEKYTRKVKIYCAFADSGKGYQNKVFIFFENRAILFL